MLVLRSASAAPPVGFGGTALGGLAMGAVSELLGLSVTCAIWGAVCVAAVALSILVSRRHA